MSRFVPFLLVLLLLFLLHYLFIYAGKEEKKLFLFLSFGFLAKSLTISCRKIFVCGHVQDVFSSFFLFIFFFSFLSMNFFLKCVVAVIVCFYGGTCMLLWLQFGKLKRNNKNIKQLLNKIILSQFVWTKWQRKTEGERLRDSCRQLK